MTGSLRCALVRAARAVSLCALAGASLFSGPLRAADVFWEGDDAGNPTGWEIGANWSSGATPGAGDNAFINNGRPATVSTDVGFIGEMHVRGGSRLNLVAGGKVSPDLDIGFGDEAGSSGELVMTGGLIDAFDGVRIGTAGGVGTARLTGGQLFYNSSEGFTNNASFLLGDGGEGTFHLEGGELRQVTSADVANGESWNYIGRGTGTATFNLSGGTASFNARTHVSDGASQAVVNQTGGLFEVRDHELIISDTGNGGGKGVYNISGGQLSVARDLAVGHWDNANGELNVSGTADIRVGNEMRIGGGNPTAGAPRSTGVLNQTGGSITNGGWSFIGGRGHGDGTFNFSGGTFTNNERLHVGGEDLSTGVMNQTGGNLKVDYRRDAGGNIVTSVDAGTGDTFASSNPDFLVGDGRDSKGEYNLSSGEAVIARDMFVAQWERTEGVVRVSGGRLSVGEPSLGFDDPDGDPNDHTLTGGSLRVGGYTNNQQPNHGRFEQSGGVVEVRTDFSVGAGDSSTGEYIMSGGELTIGQWTRIGDGGSALATSNGEFNMSGGQATFQARVGIGYGGRGVLNQSGGRIDFTDEKGSGIAFHIGDQATGHGEYNLSGGEAVVSGGRVQIGHWRGLDATMNVSGTGVLRTATDVHVGSEVDVQEQLTAENHGTLNQSGGSIDIGGNLIIGVFDRSNGEVNLTGGEMHNRNNVTVGDAGFATFTHTGGTHTIDGDLTIGAQAIADGLYTLDDDGVLDMTGGAMNYGAGLAQFAFEGGTLKDAGTINFTLVNNGGTLAPGASPGVTSIVGDYSVTSSSATYQVEIAGLLQGSEYDFLNVSGATSLGGRLQVLLTGGDPVLGDTNGDNVVDLDDLNNVRNNFGTNGNGDTNGDGIVDLDDLNNVRNNFGAEGTPGFVPEIGDSFTILASAGGITGTFANTLLPALPAGRHWNVSYQPNNVRLDVLAGPAAVPEPATLGLGCILAVGATWWLRRRRS